MAWWGGNVSGGKSHRDRGAIKVSQAEEWTGVKQQRVDYDMPERCFPPPWDIRRSQPANDAWRFVMQAMPQARSVQFIVFKVVKMKPADFVGKYEPRHITMNYDWQLLPSSLGSYHCRHVDAYDARGEILYATIYKFSLAEIYLEMLTSRARPPMDLSF